MTEAQTSVDGSTQVDPKTERTTKLRKAYTNATTRLREEYADEFKSLVQQEAQALGVDYKPRLTPEERAEQEMHDLLTRFPALREQAQVI